MSLEKAFMRLGMHNSSLNKLVNITYNQETLKEVIEKLMIALSDHMENTQRTF